MTRDLWRINFDGSRNHAGAVGNPEGIHMSVEWPLLRSARFRRTPVVAVKRRYRVRLNGAGHQWGKDPPKEVVG